MKTFPSLVLCLVAALVGSSAAASVLERYRRQTTQTGWNDPDHPFPESSWSDWTPCTVNCGSGYQGRHGCAYTYQFPPIVGDPPFQFGPTDPLGCPLIVAGCGGKPCVDSYDWQPFESCNATCGTGARRRYSGPLCTAQKCPLGMAYYQEIKCHTQECKKPEGCGNADIALVLDSSGSVGDVHWFMEKQFATDLVKSLDIASDETRVGAISYSTEVKLNFGFSEHTTIADLEDAIWKIPYMAASTNTADALRKARMLFEDESRSDVKKIIVVVTDGHSNILNETTIPQADLARQEGILVFAVGIGLDKNDAELVGIGNKPADTFVHHASDFDALGEITMNVVKGTCDAVVECGAWGSWSTCSKSCDGGTQIKSQPCEQKIQGVVQSTWTDSQKRQCNTHKCREPVTTCGKWTDWTQCSVTCGGGEKSRSRQCSCTLNGVVQKLWTENQKGNCSTQDCRIETCGSWTEEGSCSASCDGGQQKFVRVCKTYVRGQLVDSDTETRYEDCNQQQCPGDDSGPVCSKCPYEADYGYLPVPNDPCSFYQCKRTKTNTGTYDYEYTKMPCAPGTKWDQSILNCGHHSGECNSSPVVVVTPEPDVCNREAVADQTKYKEKTTGIVMPCAPGTVFDKDECECIHGVNPGPPPCTGPLLYFTFDGHFNSEGCEKVPAIPQGVVSLSWDAKKDRSARFEGKGLLLVPFLKNYFANNHNVQGLTVALYFKWTASPASLEGLVNNGNCETGSSFDIHVGTGSAVSASISAGQAAAATGGVSVQRWDWIHVAEVYDGRSLKLYINGKQQSSKPLTGPITNSQCSMVIGQLGREGTGLFQGHIDELKVFTRALNAEEVKNLLV